MTRCQKAEKKGKRSTQTLSPPTDSAERTPSETPYRFGSLDSLLRMFKSLPIRISQLQEKSSNHWPVTVHNPVHSHE